MLGFGLGLGLTFNPTEGKRSLTSMLFGGGEDGFLFSDFAELPELFTLYSGPPNVAADNDLVGLVLDDHGWAGGTIAQAAAPSPELRGTGTTALIGTATAATYDTSTGVGSATRAADGANQSSVTFAVTLGAVYLVDITPLQTMNVRDTATGALTTILAANAGRQQFLARPATTALFFQSANNNGTANFTIHSIKRVPGNHAAQSSAGNRPTWKANAGKPYLLFNGTSNSLISSLYPLASGSALTLAAAFNATNGANCFIGGGTPTNDKRAFIGLTTLGALTVAWGTEVSETVVVDRRNANHVMLMTADAGGRNVWLDGQDVTSLFTAPVGAPDGTGGALTLGGRQNTVGGGPDRLLAGNLSAAMALNRRVTPSEIARITAEFQRTF